MREGKQWLDQDVTAATLKMVFVGDASLERMQTWRDPCYFSSRLAIWKHGPSFFSLTFLSFPLLSLVYLFDFCFVQME